MNVSPQLTRAGWELLTRAIGGDTITFTGMKVGDGAPPAVPAELTDLVSVVYAFGITEIDTDTPQQVVVTGRYDSSQIPNDFYFRECGLFCAADQIDSFTGDGATTEFTLAALSGGGYPYTVKGITIDGTAFTGTANYDAATGKLTFGTAPASGAVIAVDSLEENLLYAYLNAGDDAGLVEKVDSLPREFVINMAVVVGEAANVTAILTTAQAYASQEDLDALDALLTAHVSRRDNPHVVTAAQLGLANVAAPTYTPGTASQPLVSGEALANALGKIAGHINDKNNPHETSVSNLTGILPINKGGTGVTTLAQLKALVGGGDLQIGTYVGNGNSSYYSARSVKTFTSAPKFVFIYGRYTTTITPGDYTILYILNTVTPDYSEDTHCRLSNNSFQVWNTAGGDGAGLNVSGQRYFYFYAN